MPHGEAIIDQTSHGLNFRTLRPPAEILQSYVAVLKGIYNPKSYFTRVLETALRLRRRPRHRPNLRERLRDLRVRSRRAPDGFQPHDRAALLADGVPGSADEALGA